MAFGTITSWQIDGETMKTVRCVIFLVSKIQKTPVPWKKNYDQPRQHIKKQRHFFANKVCLVKAMVFPIVMPEYESWTIKKAECRRTDAFETMVLGSPLDCKEIQPVDPKGNQS